MRETNASRPHRSPLFEQARQLMRVKHMSIRTESAYLGWMERFIYFHREKVSASTQNQAFSALLFLFREILKTEIQINAVRAKKPDRLPVVLSVDEVRRVRLIKCLEDQVIAVRRQHALDLEAGAGWVWRTKEGRVSLLPPVPHRTCPL